MTSVPVVVHPLQNGVLSSACSAVPLFVLCRGQLMRSTASDASKYLTQTASGVRACCVLFCWNRLATASCTARWARYRYLSDEDGLRPTSDEYSTDIVLTRQGSGVPVARTGYGSPLAAQWRVRFALAVRLADDDAMTTPKPNLPCLTQTDPDSPLPSIPKSNPSGAATP